MSCNNSNNKTVDCVERIDLRVEVSDKTRNTSLPAKMSLWICMCRACGKQCGFPLWKIWLDFPHTQSTLCPDSFPQKLFCAQACAQTVFALKNQQFLHVLEIAMQYKLSTEVNLGPYLRDFGGLILQF